MRFEVGRVGQNVGLGIRRLGLDDWEGLGLESKPGWV